jgi:hypothetical protein
MSTTDTTTTPPTGWVPFEDRTSEQNDSHAAAVGSMPPFLLVGSPAKTESRVCLWEAHKRIFGRFAPYNWQVTGSCVGAGGDNCVKTLAAVEIAFGAEPEEWFKLWWPLTYGISRLYAGMRGRGAGSFGSAYAKAARDYGFVAAGKDGVPDLPEKDGWLKLTESIEYEWSAGEVHESKWKDLARVHLVGSVAPIRSADEAAAAIRDAKAPLTLASMFGTRGSRPMGNPVVNVAEWDGRWAHQMFADEWWDHPELGELFRVGNNWGPTAFGTALPPTQGEPPGGYYVTKSTFDRICREGEVYAFSRFAGFPARDWPWLF